MSPYIRSMLEDAADDHGRPVATDLDRIRVAGRRSVWRRRGLVGAGGLGVVAVVTSVALLVPSVGGTSGDVAGSPGAAPTSEPVDTLGGPEPWQPSPVPEALYPLVDAIAAAGYDVEVDGSQSTGVSGASEMSSPDGAIEKTLMTTAFGVAKDDAIGAVVVAEFTDVEMLQHTAVFGNDPGEEPPPGSQQCAVLPPGATDADFAWTACDKQPWEDGEVWRGTASGPGASGLGVTLVRADGSGLSITLSTAAFSYVGYASSYDQSLPTTLPAAAPLAQLPLTHDALAEVVTSIAASGPVFSVEAVPEPATEDPTFLEACSTGTVLAEMVDDAGRSSLVEADGRTYACTTGIDPDALLDVMDVTDWPALGDAVEPWHFGFGYVTICERLQRCASQVRLGVGSIPDDVDRITFETPDGQISDAQIVAGTWLFRYVETGQDPNEQPAPIIVRVYDGEGVLLVEGDVSPPPPPDAPPALPPPGPPPGVEETAPQSGEETATP